MKKVIKKVFNSFGFELSQLQSFKDQVKLNDLNNKERFELKNAVDRLQYIVSKTKYTSLESLTISGFFHYSIGEIVKSKSQIFQDLFVLYCLKKKMNGFFVEFGSTDGINLSNTFLLEKQYHWKGILAEPANIWKDKLLRNRNCEIETNCVWSESDKILTFYETETAELSTIDVFADKDTHYENRRENRSYNVKTISLNDLLKKYDAPFDIDYLSIDTEGYEFDILNSFDFSKYNITIITVEHNYTIKREEIFSLLTSKGYKRVFDAISLFDDWYVKEYLLNSFQ